MTDSTDDFCANCWKNLNFISKPYCNICGRRFDISILHGVSCSECLRNRPYYDTSRSLMKFDEYSRRIIHSFKYKDKTVLAKTFAKLLYRQCYQELNIIDLIVPVPMNRFKRLFRMYNPAYLLAMEISKLLTVQLIPDILIKSKWTKSQTYLSKSAREKNLADSLILKDGRISYIYVMTIART